MTLVLAWFNNETTYSKSIWIASDTKISYERAATLEGNKIFELSIVCKNISGEPGKIEYRSNLIFAYAGSSMLAVNTYATLNTILSNLGGGNALTPHRPDCVSILNVALSVLKTHNESIQTYAEFLISGVCPKTKRLFIGRITTRKTGADGGIEYKGELTFGDSGEFTYLTIGGHLAEIDAVINKRLSDREILSKNEYWRIPLTILSELIVNQTYEDIGGNIQLATVHQDGNSQLCAVTPNIDTHLTNMKYQNINTTEQIGRFVGECLIAIPGVIIDINSVDAWAKERWPDKFNL